MYTVYSLNCPDTGKIKYIGMTSDIEKRYKAHLCDNNNFPKSQWVQGLLSAGKTPVLKIIKEFHNVGKASAYEIKLIKKANGKYFNRYTIKYPIKQKPRIVDINYAKNTENVPRKPSSKYYFSEMAIGEIREYTNTTTNHVRSSYTFFIRKRKLPYTIKVISHENKVILQRTG